MKNLEKTKDKSTKIKGLYFILFTLIFLLNGTAFAQFPDSTTAVIDSNATNSAAVDLGAKKLLSIHFPATVTSDTVFVQTRRTTTGGWNDAYYLDGSAVKRRVHIVVDVGNIVGIHPSMTFYLLRYIRIVADDAEGDERTLTVYRGNH